MSSPLDLKLANLSSKLCFSAFTRAGRVCEEIINSSEPISVYANMNDYTNTCPILTYQDPGKIECVLQNFRKLLST